MSRTPPAEIVLHYADGHRRTFWSSSAIDLLPIVEHEARCAGETWVAPVHIALSFRKRRELTEIVVTPEMFALLQRRNIRLTLTSEGETHGRRLYGAARFLIWTRSPECTAKELGVLASVEAPVVAERTDAGDGVSLWSVSGKWRPVADAEVFAVGVLDRWRACRRLSDRLRASDSGYRAEVGFEFSAGADINYIFSPETVALMCDTCASLHLFVA